MPASGKELEGGSITKIQKGRSPLQDHEDRKHKEKYTETPYSVHFTLCLFPGLFPECQEAL
jgi:hypothetical protein